ncbi:unnamed protein product [Vicia faba]|uniref:DEK-C domain-containing protein n=1 Tax=Vicia faba TaxID=3906 RepID=A0AAV0YLS1_VICFA|nr:unnamed protein product [Vicia faba]
MGEEESVNTVSRTDSNGNITPEKTLDDMGDKKGLESEGGKTLEDNEVEDVEGDDIKEMEVDKKADNEVKDLKEDDIKEMEVDKKADNEVKDLKGDDIKKMEVDKKADGEEELEVEEDKKADDCDVVIDDNKVGDGEEIKEDEKVEGENLKEDKKVNEAEEIKDDKKVNEEEELKDDKKVNEREDFKEDKKVDEGGQLKEDKKADEGEELKEEKGLNAGEEIKDDKKDVGLKESEDDEKDDFVNETKINKKDDNEFEDDKLGEETDVKETMDSKEGKESIEAKKLALDVMEKEDVPEDKHETGEKDKGQEKVEDVPEYKGESGKKEKGQEKVEDVPEYKGESGKKEKSQEKEENDKVKVGDKSTEEDIIVEKASKKRGRGKGNMEKVKKKVKEQKGIPEDKDEISEKMESQEEEEDANDKVDYKSNEDDSEDMGIEKGLKRRRRRNIHEKQVKETEARTPASASATNRPVRDRKSVERLVESYERDISKEFFIDEGSGMHLKDIPNVAFKLSRRKVDDTLKFLHTILFCRRGKAAEVKKNISRFSGFVWYENEEKQMIKVKEKFDKCNKEKLLDICDVLDIQVAKANTRKEDIIAKLINFLVAPHVRRDVLLEEQEKPVKGKKRKHITKQGSSRSGTSTSRRSAKSRKKNEDSSDEERNTTTDIESDSEKEDEKGVPDRSEDEMPQKSESEDRNDSESDNESEDVKKMSKINKIFSREKEFAAKGKAKETTFQKKPRTPRKRTSKKSFSTHSESDDDISEGSPKVFSRKKKNEKQKTSTFTKSSSKDNTAEKVTKRKGKNKEKSNPSDDQLRNAICDIFKQVDFNTATFTDILKLLGKQFNKDLTPRKASLKIMIQKELTKLADEEEEGDGENDETHTTNKEVEA